MNGGLRTRALSGLRGLAGRVGPRGPRQELWDRSRERWRHARPDTALTWGAELDGEAFVDEAEGLGAFGPDRAVLEVGPGYGRLLASVLARDTPFASWTAVDLSEENVKHLRRRFDRPDVSFLRTDVEELRLEQPADTVLASLTFKHLFPSFEKAAVNLAAQVRPGALLLFDLIEGRRRFFEEDGVTYIRWYSRPEVRRILQRAGFSSVEFDEVRHHPDMPRLLVAARRLA